jgi:hypothetical protein
MLQLLGDYVLALTRYTDIADTALVKGPYMGNCQHGSTGKRNGRGDYQDDYRNQASIDDVT